MPRRDPTYSSLSGYPPAPHSGSDSGPCSLPAQLKSFHNELLTQLEQKVELDARYLSVSSPAPQFLPLTVQMSPSLPLRAFSPPCAPSRSSLAPTFLPVGDREPSWGVNPTCLGLLLSVKVAACRCHPGDPPTLPP